MNPPRSFYTRRIEKLCSAARQINDLNLMLAEIGEYEAAKLLGEAYILTANKAAELAAYRAEMTSSGGEG